MAYKQIRPIIVSEGGTGNTSLTIHTVLLGNSTSAITQLANGTTGQILTAVTGLDPSWQAPAASSISITGNTGGALVGSAFTFTGGTTGLAFGGSGTTFTTTFAGITANGGTVSLATDATTSTINVGTGAGIKTTTLGSATSTSTTSINAGSTTGIAMATVGGAFNLTTSTGTISISTDAAATTLNIGTGGAVKGVTLGSTNSTSTTTIQNGSGALAITSTNGTITMNSGTGTLAIANDATAQTVNIATGAGAKLVTLGTTNGASSLALKTGTADFTLASATGTIMSALDTGEITYPLQPAFFAYLGTQDTDVTGDSTAFTLGSGNALTEIYDQNGDFNTNGTFTAPVTGRYLFSGCFSLSGVTALFTSESVTLIASNRNVRLSTLNPGPIGVASSSITVNGAAYVDMDAADTVVLSLIVGGSAKTVDVSASTNAITYFSGQLCV